MAVSQGNLILASQYNILKDEVNKWFGDPNPSMLLGDSDQTWGWGGSEASAVVQGNLMQASEINALVDRCNIGQDIVNNVSGALPTIVAGNKITATEFNNAETKSDSINTNRNNIEVAEMSTTFSGSSVRTTNWSASIDCILRYVSPSLANFRYFWNSGGAMQISGNITGYSTGTGWDGAGVKELFTNMGTLTADRNSTTISGSGTGGTITSLGYYSFSNTTWSTIYSAVGTGAYSDTILTVSGHTAADGKNVYVRFQLWPGSGRTVNGTTTISCSYRKLDNQSSGGASLVIPTPTYVLHNTLE